MILRCEGVTKRYGGVTALDAVDLSVELGAVLGIVGPNGSGKTTLVNIITGFVTPDEGAVYFHERQISGLRPHTIARRGIARTFQTARPLHRLTATQSLIVPLYSPRVRKRRGRWGDRGATALDLLEEVGFERDSRVPYQLGGTLPQGYLRRLELARCVALEAEVIVTDELFSGLSNAEIASMVPFLQKLNLEGVTLVMVEHRLKELFMLAHRVVALERGSVAMEGTPDQVRDDPRLAAAYLGE